MTLSLARLVTGSYILFRLRATAMPADAASERLAIEERAALGLARPVRIAAHRRVNSPITLGGIDPIVLVPCDWDRWAEADRRAVVRHELSHLERRDDWAKLFQELVRVPFFFHPLVSWLLARLDRERELLCDESVIELGEDPTTYAPLLLELARRPSRCVPTSRALRPGLLPFLDRRTVSIRILTLLEDPMPNTDSTSGRRRFALLATLFLLGSLALGSLRLKATEPRTAEVNARDAESQASPKPAPSPKENPVLRGAIRDAEDRPIADATVVVGLEGVDPSRRSILKADGQGRFSWTAPPGEGIAYVYAHKEGWGWGSSSVWLGAPQPSRELPIRLGKPESFRGRLVDDAGRPIQDARIQIEMTARKYEAKGAGGGTVSIGYDYIRPEIVEGTPLEGLFQARTDGRGDFVLNGLAPGSGLRLRVVTADGKRWRVKDGASGERPRNFSVEGQGFLTAPPGKAATLTITPAARVQGRVLTSLPGVGTSGLKVFYQASRPRQGEYTPETNFGGTTVTDAEGRFAFDDLNEGTINIMLGVGADAPWTYRAAQDVDLKLGWTRAVKIELIKGVEVTGTVVAQGTKQPVAGVQMGTYGPFRPRSGAATTGATTDAQGRYRYRLPSGETYFYVMGPPDGYTSLPGQGSSRTVTIPEGATRFEVPAIEIVGAVTVRGRVLDSAGDPVPMAKVIGVCQGGTCRAFTTEVVTDPRGEFQLPPGPNNTVPIGMAARLQVRLADGSEHEAAVMPGPGGSVTVKLPVLGKGVGKVEGPDHVGPDELAGVVVDRDGKPIADAEVDAWTWYAGNETKTDARGWFRLGNLGAGKKIEVLVRKAGYSPQLSLAQPTGQAGWVVVLGDKTYFEGTVTDAQGKPVADALIRANNGPKQAEGVMITELWTEARTDASGRYRMYAQGDVYDLQVRAPGRGVHREQVSLAVDEARRLDLRLEEGVTFRVRMVDAVSGQPVQGVRLSHWQHPGIEGTSDEDGLMAIADMLPGRFSFEVNAAGYARWWSDRAASEWNRKETIDRLGGWQRNFDQLDFDLSPGMDPVTIALEQGVTIEGRVLDPEGKPVDGATVAPALTGTGNSLTGDTRFSVESDGSGEFTALLPASHERDYNLIAHDGKYGQWRTWANGVLPPFRTRPGERREKVTLSLARPATVRGRLVDASGVPVAGREIRASAADRLENRYYDPTTTTGGDGIYTLRFLRPGEQFIQVAPFWLNARQAPAGTSRSIKLSEGETKEGVDFALPAAGE